MFRNVLRDAGFDNFVAHDDQFGQLTPDPEWIQFVGERRLIAITMDRRIGRKPFEILAIYRWNVPMIFLKQSGGHRVAAQNFLNSIDPIERFVARQETPFIARLSQPRDREEVAAGVPGRISMYKSREKPMRQLAESGLLHE